MRGSCDESAWVPSGGSGCPRVGQTTVAPTNERVGEARGVTIGNYSLLQSWKSGTG